MVKKQKLSQILAKHLNHRKYQVVRGDFLAFFCRDCKELVIFDEVVESGLVELNGKLYVEGEI